MHCTSVMDREAVQEQSLKRRWKRRVFWEGGGGVKINEDKVK